LNYNVVWCALGFPLNFESKSQSHNYKGCCKLILVVYAYVIRMLVLNILTLFFLYHDMILQPYYYVVSTLIFTQCICRSLTEKQGLHQDVDPKKLYARLRKLQKCQIF